MKRKGLIILTVTLLSLSSCKEKVVEPAPVRPVIYQEVGYLGGDDQRTFSGTAKTERVINLSFRSSGIITLFNLKIGQLVKKGDLLAKLDNVQARLNYESAISAQNSAASEMNTAKLSLQRTKVLYEKGSLSLSEYESAKNAYKTAQAGFESAKRKVGIEAEQIKFGFLYAPEDGIIAAVNAEIEENVSPGQNIAVLNAGTEMEISLGLPESIINRVNQGMGVIIEFPVLTDAKFSGVVTEVSPSVDINTATYPVRIVVKIPSTEIRSGMAANITFQFEADKNQPKQLVVPPISVGEDGNGRFVFLIKEEADKTTVHKQYIKVGALSSEGFAIMDGLSLGDKIATAGLQTLLHGQEVRLQ
ncbi:MAG: efflux RND transporter periplasmic adaptor subunit [Eudoraea sp.]|uniref:efflux RND transporter periplasmic adaptor subunit n=1 Tax=Eudoraea sp. TaxID=1979955 RepID=UPI003C7630FE